jgi:hypothetical protein
MVPTKILTRMAAVGIMTAMASGDKMANYYPLISKAVASVASGESRQALYDRVRAALLSELRVADPPFSEFQIIHERLALEDAVRKVEEEAVQRDRDLPMPAFDEDVADDVGTSIDVPLMVLTGGATARMDLVWRFVWR